MAANNDSTIPPGESARSLRAGWRDLWQAPLLLAAVSLIGAGIGVWIKQTAPPEFAQVLDNVAQLLEREQYAQAMARLNDPVAANLHLPQADQQVHARFHALSGDALYLAQRSRGVDLAANHAAIAAHYREARDKYHAELPPRRQQRLADAYISLGRIDDAWKELAKLPDEEAPRRHLLLKRIAELGLAGDPRGPDHAGVMRALQELRADPALSDKDQLWVVARQAELRLAQGQPEAALTHLLQEMQRLDAGATLAPHAGELFVLLGMAYHELGQSTAAREHLMHALDILEHNQPLYGRALVVLGRLAQAEGAIEQAHDHFTIALREFPYTDIAAAAALGLGEIAGERGDIDASIHSHLTAIELLNREPPRRPGPLKPLLTDEMVLHSLFQWHEVCSARGDHAAALRYVRLGLELNQQVGDPPPAPPAELLLRQALSHRRIAEQMPASDKPAPVLHHLHDSHPPPLQTVRQAYLKAAQAFAHHAEVCGPADPQRELQSIWMAADCYDRAGDGAAAGKLFREFAAHTLDETKQLETQWRMAQISQSLGDYADAIQQYRMIIQSKPNSLHAHQSYIPLAHCLVLHASGKQTDEDIQRAEDILLQLVSGELFEPGAPEYVNARVELGKFYQRRGRYDQAIINLSEAAERDPVRASRADLLYALGDSYRLSAQEIGKELQTPRPGREAAELEALQVRRLTKALELFQELYAQLEAKDAASLTPLQQVMLQNAGLYRGDCAYALAELAKAAGGPAWQAGYLQAIHYYDVAAQQQTEAAASLVAMIQIVNCYAALGRWPEAETAHARARSRLAELPAAAWEDGLAPMSREYWEQWLKSSIRLHRMAAASGE